MAKKQGLQSIMGQADTTLVNTAYRMGMANVPKDLSGIHNKIGDSYAAGMKDLGAGFGALAGAAINKGIELSKKAKEEKDGNAGAGYRNAGKGTFGNVVKGFFGKVGDAVTDLFDGGGFNFGYGGIGERKAKEITEKREKQFSTNINIEEDDD